MLVQKLELCYVCYYTLPSLAVLCLSPLGDFLLKQKDRTAPYCHSILFPLYRRSTPQYRLCTICTNKGLLSTVLPHRVHWSVHSVPVTVHSLYYRMYVVKVTVHSLHCRVYSIQCACYMVICTLYIVEWTVYKLQCTFHIVEWTMSGRGYSRVGRRWGSRHPGIISIHPEHTYKFCQTIQISKLCITTIYSEKVPKQFRYKEGKYLM